MREPAKKTLSKCPVCGYSLKGLPSAHRCPECSFHYDDHTRIWRPPKPKAIFGTMIIFFGGYTGFFNLFLDFSSLSPTVRLFAQLGFLIFVASCVYMGWRLYRIYRQGQFAAVGPDGIHYRLRSPESQFIPWDKFTLVEPQRNYKLCRIIRNDGQAKVTISGVFSSNQDAMAFTNLAQKRYQQNLEHQTLNHPEDTHEHA